MTWQHGSGWKPGLLGWCVAEHGRYYADNWGFSVFFEAKVAADLAEFAGRLDQPGNRLLWAEDDSGCLGSVALDHGDAVDGLDHLRWFIVAAGGRGKGIGRQLLARCREAARAFGSKGIYLTTFAGLDAARKLYEDTGFLLVSEQDSTTWGTPVREQRFEVRF